MATHELITPFLTLSQHEAVNRSLRTAYFEYDRRLQHNPNLPEAVFYLEYIKALRSNHYPVERLPQEYLPRTLGLKATEVTPVIDVATELVSNVLHGVAGARLSAELMMTMDINLSEKQIEERDDLLIDAFNAAWERKLPKGYLKIRFNDESVEGLIEVRHPVIPEYSAPPIRRAKNNQILREKRNSRGRWGGLYNVEEGIIHERLIYAGLQPNEQVVFTEEPDCRIASLHFKRI